MLHRETDPQYMEAIKDYRHTEAGEGLCDSEELQTHIPPVPHLQAIIIIIKEQAGFRPEKSCTSQLLNLTQHIEDGYQRGMITGAAFVDLSAAYDTVNHRILIQKLCNTTQDSQLCSLSEHAVQQKILCGTEQ